MKTYLTSNLLFLLLFDILLAQPFFVSSIQFKGQTDGVHFKGREFDVKFLEETFHITEHRIGNKFVIKRDNDSILDIVFSPNRTSVAISMNATNHRNRQRSLITIDADGNKKTYNYEAYEMTKRLGWVVELGSVSNDGLLILAKCAYMLPENEEGHSHVQHEWTILEIGDTAIKILESNDAIDKWSDYTRNR